MWGGVGVLLNIVILQAVGYGIIYLLALLWNGFNAKQKLCVFLIYGILTCIYVYVYGFDVQCFKYPPTELYFTYGVICTLILYEVLKALCVSLNKESEFAKCILWLSINSFTIYFAHVFIVYFFDYGKILREYWWIQYIILLVGAIGITIVLKWIGDIARNLKMKLKNKRFKICKIVK